MVMRSTARSCSSEMRISSRTRRPSASVRPEQRVGDGVRLVVDLLLHEGRVAALLGGRGVPRDLVRLALGGRAVEVDDGGAVGRDRDDLVLGELERVARVADEGGDVGAEVVRVVAEADDERAVAAGADDDAGLVGVDGEEREGALEVGDDGAHRVGQVVLALVGGGDEVGDDLGVGLARELDAVGQQALLQGVEVLDDAVVDEGELAVLATAVRVGVLVGRAAVRGPAGVADAGRRRRQRVGLELGRRGWPACPTSCGSRRGRRRAGPRRPSRSRGTRAGPGPP